MIRSDAGCSPALRVNEGDEQIYQRVSPDLFETPTLELARALLGKILVRRIKGQILSGEIVETEAYLGGKDPASHAYGGITKRNSVMFGPAGYAYVYFIYGNHYCLNVVSGPKGRGEAVLIRALHPVDGLEQMRKNRSQDSTENLTNGPGKLCQAMGIDVRLNGTCFDSETLYLAEGEILDKPMARSTRVGITKAKEKRWRFYLKGDPFVSNHREARK